MKIKMLNVKGIAILAAVLLAFQLAFGLLISPAVSSAVIKMINKSSGSKITVEKVHVWPLTLSVSLKGLKVFDPAGKERMVEIKKASARLSFLGLLSKRLVIARLSVNGAEINLRSEPDGSFNIEKIAQPAEPAEAAPEKPKSSVFDRFRKGKDWFSRIYDVVKKRGSKEGVEKAKEERESAKKVTREVVQLPHGRRVKFETIRSGYLLEIRDLSMKDVSIHAEADEGRSIDLKDGAVILRGVAVDPKRGARFDALRLKGSLEKAEKPAGSFTLSYTQSFKGDDVRTDVDLASKNIDMAAISFIYEDSLPVEVKRGILNLNSDTTIINDALDSKNSLSLRDHDLEPKGGMQAPVGFVPVPTLCEALDKVDPVKLKFDITGTVENPKFTGFQDSLMALVKPYLADVTKDIEKKGISAIGDLFKKEAGGEAAPSQEGGKDAGQEAVDTIKSLFGK